MDRVILKPLVFCGHVTRKLSDWCSVIPAIDVTAELEAVEVCVCVCDLNDVPLQVSFSPEDFQAVMSVVDSINDGRKEAELHKGWHLLNMHITMSAWPMAAYIAKFHRAKFLTDRNVYRI